MKTDFTKNIFRLKFFCLFGLCIFLLPFNSIAQKWSGVNGNEWLENKYGQKFLRLEISSRGLHKIPFSNLPDDFSKDPSTFQLWHRGKEVSILSTANNEILFYGEINDGASDALLYRPNVAARVNPYVSLYSDKGVYFLTTAASPARAQVKNVAVSGTPEPYHIQKIIQAFEGSRGWFSLSTLTTQPNPLVQSYLETYRGWTSKPINGPNTSLLIPDPYISVQPEKKKDNPFAFTNWVPGTADKAKFEVLINGLHYGQHEIRVSVGPSALDSDHQNSLANMNFSGLQVQKSAQTEIPDANLSASGGVLRVKSVSNSTQDQYGLTYYTISYPQETNMSSSDSIYFNFGPSNATASRLNIKNTTADVQLYDITNIDSPAIIMGSRNAGTSLYDAMVPRLGNNSSLRLFCARPSTVREIAREQITEANWQPVKAYPDVANAAQAIDPSAYDYLIITNELLVEEAKLHAQYRNSVAGGSYKVAVFDIKDIYNQFNYGEPSPVAIKRFVDYMIKNGIRDKHNLLLIGNSVSLPYHSPTTGNYRLVKDMPGEIPPIGDPGSDELLVSGLHNLDQDMPAIPVGRIPAFVPGQVANYRNKVVLYESQTDLGWRKNVLHMIGAQSVEELTTFGNIFANLLPIATANERAVTTLKTNGGFASVPANITGKINDGVGMITYFGHGNWNVTQLNIGRVTLPNNSTASTGTNEYNYFTNEGGTYNTTSKKFPFIYFNGCGVGNIFSSRSQTNLVLASDWLNAQDRGAIAIIGSTYSSYESPTKAYLDILYDKIFKTTDANRKTLGHIKRDVASSFISTNNGRVAALGTLDELTLHQALLFGDPAVTVLNSTVPPALPVSFLSFQAIASGKSAVHLEWETAWEKNNAYFILEKSYNAKNWDELGRIEGKGTTIEGNKYTFLDFNPLKGVNYYRIKQVDLDGTVNSYSRIVNFNIEGSESLDLFPNPATDLVKIRLNVPTQIQKWSMFDIKGRLLSTGKEEDVSMNKYPAGSYFFEIITSNGDVYHKQIIKN